MLSVVSRLPRRNYTVAQGGTPQGLVPHIYAPFRFIFLQVARIDLRVRFETRRRTRRIIRSGNLSSASVYRTSALAPQARATEFNS